MSEITHTPGPWSYRKADDHDGYDIDSDNGAGPEDWIGLARVEKFADYAQDDDTEPARCAAESLANARLIASAPELLEALDSLTSEVDKRCTRGRIEGTTALALAVFAARAAIAKAKGESEPVTAG